MNRLISLAAVVVVCAVPPVAAGTWEGTCVEVVDGDTVRVTRGEGTVLVHLFGIDAPELGQERGDEVRAFFEALVLERGAAVEVVASGAEGEVIAKLVVDGQDAAEALMTAGLAWLADEGESTDEYALALFLARGEEKGIWADADPVHPADWLKKQVRQVAPTPAPRTLADVAASMNLKKGPDGKVVIADLPAMFTILSENRSAALYFAERMAGLRGAVDEISELYKQYRDRCQGAGGQAKGGAGDGSSGSVWSEESGEWVSGSGSGGYDCAKLLEERDEVRQMISDEKAKAVAAARQSGVLEVDINGILNYFELQSY